MLSQQLSRDEGMCELDEIPSKVRQAAAKREKKKKSLKAGKNISFESRAVSLQPTLLSERRRFWLHRVVYYTTRFPLPLRFVRVTTQPKSGEEKRKEKKNNLEYKREVHGQI